MCKIEGGMNLFKTAGVSFALLNIFTVLASLYGFNL